MLCNSYYSSFHAYRLLQITLALTILKEHAFDDVIDANLITVGNIFKKTLSYYDIDDDEKLSEPLLDSLNDKLTEYPVRGPTKILYIASGVVGDDKINWHKAREDGIASISKLTGQTFNNIKLKRIENALHLFAAGGTVEVHEELVPINPVLLLQRMSVTKTFEDEIEIFFAHE